MAIKKAKSKGGGLDNASKYDPRFCDEVVKYFDKDPAEFKDMTIVKADGTSVDKAVEEAAPLPTIGKFCRAIGISVVTFEAWRKAHEEFDAAVRAAKQLQEEFIMENALRGNYNATFSIFTMKNIAGWRDEQFLGGKDGPVKELVIRYA